MNYGLSKTRARLAGSAAILAMSAGVAMAQDTGVEQVVVSSTRLQAAGFDAPTPTTVVSAADLEANAQPSVFDAITQLPALQGSTGESYNTGSTTTGLQGLSALGLRGLSPLRTLVLLDGQRYVGSNFNGVVDVSQMPQALIQRVDVVTGGASASWGSDAVAGVVNFVTDKKFEGFKANLAAGISTYGDAGNTLAQFAAGSSFLGGRAHFEVAGEYSYTDGLLPYSGNSSAVAGQFTSKPDIGGRRLYRQIGTASYASIGATPAGQPQTYFGILPQRTTDAPYGVVTAGPKIGYTFGANSLASPFKYAGNCSLNAAGTALTVATGIAANGAPNGTIGGQCFGTSANPGDQTINQKTNGLVDPLTRGDIYSRVSYDLSPTTEVYATVTLAQARSYNIPAQGNSDRAGLSLKCDNAFLPGTNLFGLGLNGAETQAACLAAYPGNSIGFGTDAVNIPIVQQVFLSRATRRFVVGGDGTFNVFGKDWSWDTYFQHGESDTSVKIDNMPLSGRFNAAIDSIVDPATGNIVCRSADARANGCTPYNPLGNGVATQSAVQYFDNQAFGTTTGPTAIMTQRQEAFSFAVNGSPIADWAGDVSVALGVEYREEYYTQRADPYSSGVTASTPITLSEPCTDATINCGVPGLPGYNATSAPGNAWNAGNFHDGRGNYHVQEAFVETGVPLLNDSFWGKADLDLAGRFEHYSTAGDFTTWKVGATWDTPIPGIRLRALQSRDTRAPNLSELFSPPQGLNGSITNDYNGQANQTVRQLNEGNPLLKPERGQTTNAGIVWQPDFIPGFQVSVDYYRIAVKGVVSSLGLQNVEDLCYNGFTAFCGQDAITTANGVNQNIDPAHGAGGSANAVTQVHSKAFNAASLLTDGFDIESSYQFDLQDWDIPGNFTLRELVNRTSKFIIDPGVVGQATSIEYAGYLGGGNNSQTYNQSGGNVLNWKFNTQQSYQNDTWGLSLTERWLAGGVSQTKNYIVCNPGTCPVPTIQNPTTNYDKVSSAFYLDVGANWNYTDKVQFYGKIDNITNLTPPSVNSSAPNNTLYDVIGRMYRIGIRFNN